MRNTNRDEELLNALQANPREGFSLLFREFYPDVCRHIYRILPDRSVVEDIAQEIFIEIWHKRHEFDRIESPGGYLHRMAVTRTLNYIRDNRRHRYESDDALKFKLGEESTPLQKIQADDLQGVITKGIDSLPDRCRQVFVLSRFENMTNREIAESLDISVKTVENQMTKALKTLREAVRNFRSLQ